MVRHGTVQYDSLLGGFPLLSVPGNWYFLVPPPTRFKAIHTFTKTWCVNSTDHWLAGENRHYCVTELTTRDLTDLNQHSQRRIGCNFCLNKHTFLYQPKNVSWYVEEVQMYFWSGSSESLMGRRGMKTPYVYTFCNLYIFRVYFLFIFLPLYLCFASIKKNLIK